MKARELNRKIELKEPVMSSKPDKKPDLDRRSFFKSLGGASAVAAVAVGVPVAATPAAASEGQSERTKARYKETDHVKTFYRTNRY